jgi:hypothetical protein
MSVAGHFRQIDPLPTLSACPLRSDRVRTFAPQRIDAVCTHPDSCSAAKRLLFDHLVGDGKYAGRREQLVTLATRAALPTIYGQREFMSAGGLMSYATDLPGVYHQAGIYTGKVLGGARPSDLPVVQSTKFEFVLNLKTAKALGLTVPAGVLSIADEVIE